MFYWFAAISLGTFLVGYMMGLNKGLRNAHRDIVMRQIKRSKSTLDRHRSKKTKDVYDPIWSSKPSLRLVKKDDTRE